MTVGSLLLGVLWDGLLIGAAFLAGRASHDPPSPAEQTVISSLGLLVDEGLLTKHASAELWREHAEKVRAS